MSTNLPRLELLEDGSIFSTGDITKRDEFVLTFSLDGIEAPLTALRLEVLPDDRLPDGGPGRSFYEGRRGDFFLSEVTAALGQAPIKFAGASHSYGKISIGSGSADAANVLDGDGSTGWSTAEREGEPHQLVLNFSEPVPPGGELEVTLLFERHFAASLGRFRFAATTAAGDVRASSLPVDLSDVLARRPNDLTPEEQAGLRRQFALSAPELATARDPIDKLRKRLPQRPATLVFEERPADNPRPTHRHHRGEYLQPQEAVAAGIPRFLAANTAESPEDRLEFARWLVSESNPLIGRVTVDRAWRRFWGRGLTTSSADLGVQSDPPTHPALLDWLACEFVDRGWSQKDLHRLIVTTAAYRQVSAGTPEQRELDPDNKWYARGARLRLDAELVRDAMLRASGLLEPRIGGPSVYPPQPGIVTELAYGNTAWPVASGPDRYRRSLYTFSKRTAPFAAYSVFDAPSGEVCLASRDRSTTPLQSLTLLNDDMYLEFARAIGRDVSRPSSTNDAAGGGPADHSAMATKLFERLLTRSPTGPELSRILEFRAAQLSRLEAGELNSGLVCGQASATPEQAAWTLTARALMNLEEAITRP
ncbi:MAG: DUF1553 domain-containing protein [Planctomycetaceae bacterium]